MNKDTPDPRTEEPGICGISYVGATGIEWVCIAKVHDQGYKRKSTDPHHKGYAYGTGSHPERYFTLQAPPAERHYFVVRYPHRLHVKEA